MFVETPFDTQFDNNKHEAITNPDRLQNLWSHIRLKNMLE